MKIQKQIAVQLTKKGMASSVRVVQFDTGVQLVFNIMDFEIPSGTRATLFVRKRSGNFVYQEKGVTVSENTVKVDLENQALTEHGETFYQLELKNGADTISTFASSILVERKLADAAAVESKTVISAFEGLTADKIAEIEAATTAQIEKVENASQTEQEAIANKGVEVLESIPEDYNETYKKMVKTEREKSDAIELSATGEEITVKDSSDDYLRNIRIFGKTTQIKTTGAQMFDKSTATQGMLEENGSVTVDGAYFTSDFIPILPKTAYHQTEKQSIRAKYYDKDKKPLSDTWDVQITTEATFTTYENAYFIRLTVSSAKVNEFMLNKGTTGLPYEPYSGGKPSPCPEYPQELKRVGENGEITVEITGDGTPQQLIVATPNGLCGIPVSSGGNYTDSNGQQWLCDEVDLDKGVFIKRTNTIVFDGSSDEIWYEELVLDNTVMFRIGLLDSVNVGNVVGKDFYCSHLPVTNMYNTDVTGAQHTMQQFYFRFEKSVLGDTSLNGFKNWLANNPMTVVYTAKTPTETPLLAEEIKAFWQSHSNYLTTTISNDDNAYMEVKYNGDLQTYIDNQIYKVNTNEITFLTDVNTGKVYGIQIVDGKLTMKEVTA